MSDAIWSEIMNLRDRVRLLESEPWAIATHVHEIGPHRHVGADIDMPVVEEPVVEEAVVEEAVVEEAVVEEAVVEEAVTSTQEDVPPDRTHFLGRTLGSE